MDAARWEVYANVTRWVVRMNNEGVVNFYTAFFSWIIGSQSLRGKYKCKIFIK